jgi:dUTP pyrophosphatase
MKELVVETKILPHGQGLNLPVRATDGAAGLDLIAALDERVTLAPLARALVPTGLAMAIPHGFEGQVRPRSGLAWKHGVTVVNSPGTIDSDYRGEIKVQLINLGHEPVSIERGDRIAQLIVAPVTFVRLEPVAALNETVRGEGGFGSTGTKSGTR